MAEFVLRAGHNDHVVLTELLTDPSALRPRLSRQIRRVVVDATAVVRQPAFAQAAYASGTQLLIDPQTLFLTSPQDPADSWARLSFATPDALDPRELLHAAARSTLIADVVDFQIEHGATAIIPPYLHITDFGMDTAKVQRRLLAETADHLHSLGVTMPIFPMISVDQRAVSLDAAAWQDDLARVVRAAHRVSSGPIGLGLSMTTRCNRTNLHVASRIWRRLAKMGPFVAWHAGEAGLLAVAMGADGYEAGMCAGERWDVRGQQRNRTNGSEVGPRYTGAYVSAIGRSLDRAAVIQLSRVRGIHQGDLGCSDPSCCPRGFDSMLGPGRRQHAVRCRLRDLEALDAIGALRWRLRYLGDRARDGMLSARRIRAAANNTGIRVGAYPEDFEAMLAVAQGLQGAAGVARGGVA